jgi:hypothetical protein
MAGHFMQVMKAAEGLGHNVMVESGVVGPEAIIDEAYNKLGTSAIDLRPPTPYEMQVLEELVGVPALQQGTF